MITGKIEMAKDSKSGKTLGVKINDVWYSTSKWELKDMVGQTITITDTNTQNFEGGGSSIYLNEYTVGGAAAPAMDAPTYQVPEVRPGQPRTIARLADNELLLAFVGQCMTSFQWQGADLVTAKVRAKTCYEIGKTILDGSISQPETGPRRGVPEQPPTPPPSDDFDDDIPF